MIFVATSPDEWVAKSRNRLIHRSAWKKNSPKFTVASTRSDAAVSTLQQHGGTPSASKRSDLVAVVAPLCIKELRLVTMQLPENSRPSDQDAAELRLNGVLRSSISALRSSKKFV